MNRIDHFQDLIEEPAAPTRPEQDAPLVQPLKDLAMALSAKALVGAAVRPSEDGRRHHLLLWPLHRPAYRSLLVTVWVTNGRAAVVGDPMFWFSTADELTAWLEALMRREDFKVTLEILRAKAHEPVDARLERANGMATLVVVSSAQQAMLDQQQADAELHIDLPLRDGEPVPDAGALRQLDSAGVRFRVQDASVTDRTVHLDLIRMA